MTTTNEIVLHEQQDTEHLPVDRAAQIFAVSGMFPEVGSFEKCAARLLIGRNLNFSDLDSMAGAFNIIRGKVTLSANAMATAIKRHPNYRYKVIKKTIQECEIEFFEKVDGEWDSMGIQLFDMEDARRAKLGGDNWQKYPRSMLFARAISEGFRTYTPDAAGTMAPVYVEQCGETEIPRIESVEEPTGEDQYDELKQLVADWEERTGEVIVEKVCSHFGAESIEDMKEPQVATGIKMMKLKFKGLGHA